MSSIIDKENDNRFVLPNSLRGKNINSEKIIPTVCNVKIMLDKLKEKSGEYSSLEQWEKRCYKNYNIEEIKNELLLAGEEHRIKILRKHILNNDFSFLGASPFEIYIVAYVSENIGVGRATFIDYCLREAMAGTENSASAIYNVGKGDGVYLGLLNRDGTVTDWDFFRLWLQHGMVETKVKVYNKLVRDKIPEVIKKSGKSCIVRQVKDNEKFSLLKEKLTEEVQEFLQDESLEELADIMEVLVGLANSLGYNEKDLLKKREEKKVDRGGFQEGVVLERVYGD